MAALVKSIASMLLLVGVFSIPTVSARGEGGEVMLTVQQPTEEGSVLKIVKVTFVAHELLEDGEEMRLALIEDFTIIKVSMVLHHPDTWVADVTLNAGITYLVKLLHDFCPCKSTKPDIYQVPTDKDYDLVDVQPHSPPRQGVLIMLPK